MSSLQVSHFARDTVCRCQRYPAARHTASTAQYYRRASKRIVGRCLLLLYCLKFIPIARLLNLFIRAIDRSFSSPTSRIASAPWPISRSCKVLVSSLRKIVAHSVRERHAFLNLANMLAHLVSLVDSNNAGLSRLVSENPDMPGSDTMAFVLTTFISDINYILLFPQKSVGAAETESLLLLRSNPYA